MSEEIKNLIEEMKQVVLDLHRSAGDLDKYVQILEYEMADKKKPGDLDYIRAFVKCQHRYRLDTKKDKRYSSLDLREESIWTRLNIELDREEET